jgi:alkanesulfonate monooxygenase SsuD/methylene tetrahydromethanopterin reductase-like flavin-dependent oxidoreductase (luciferase family)
MLIGGSGERRTLRLVAEHADEWNVTPRPPDDYQRKAEILVEHCLAVGRDPGAIRHSIMLTHLIGRDQAEVRRRAQRLKEITGRPDAVDEILDNMRAGGRIVGTPDEVIEQIRDWDTRGIERIMLQTLDMDDIAVLELIADEVMPHVN